MAAPDLSLPVPVAADAALSRPIAALRTMLGLDASTEPDAIHRARTATRRLRSNLRSLGPILDPPDGLRADLKWLAETLGAVRDADVLAARLSGRAGLAPEQIVAGMRVLLGAVEAQRRAENERLRRDLSSVRFGNLIHELDLLAKEGSAAAGTIEAATVMRPRWRALRDAAEASSRDPSDRALHRARIETKRARYAAEVFLPTDDDRCRRFVRRARALQDLLGAQHDAVRACEWLVAVDLDDARAVRTSGWFAADAAAEREALRDAWRRRWRAVDRTKARFW